METKFYYLQLESIMNAIVVIAVIVQLIVAVVLICVVIKLFFKSIIKEIIKTSIHRVCTFQKVVIVVNFHANVVYLAHVAIVSIQNYF